LRELFVGLGIRLYARRSRRGFDIIPACAGIDMNEIFLCTAEGTEEENKEVGFLFLCALSAVKNSFPNSK
jgi:hypothetical protein